MPRFFCNPSDINLNDNSITIYKEDAQHITRVLRMRKGETVTVCDCVGFDYECTVEETGDTVLLNITAKHENVTEPRAAITLYQCLPKGDKLDFILQKAVELGCSRIVPVISRHCVVKTDAASFEKKRIRLQKIALEAAKQSGRGKIPEVAPLLSFEQAVREAVADKSCTPLFCYEGGGERALAVLSGNTEAAALFVGSEGGFSKEEAEFAKENGLLPISLGKLILRCETAPIVGITLVRAAIGEI